MIKNITNKLKNYYPPENSLDKEIEELYQVYDEIDLKNKTSDSEELLQSDKHSDSQIMQNIKDPLDDILNYLNDEDFDDNEIPSNNLPQYASTENEDEYVINELEDFGNSGKQAENDLSGKQVESEQDSLFNELDLKNINMSSGDKELPASKIESMKQEKVDKSINLSFDPRVEVSAIKQYIERSDQNKNDRIIMNNGVLNPKENSGGHQAQASTKAIDHMLTTLAKAASIATPKELLEIQEIHSNLLKMPGCEKKINADPLLKEKNNILTKLSNQNEYYKKLDENGIKKEIEITQTRLGTLAKLSNQIKKDKSGDEQGIILKDGEYVIASRRETKESEFILANKQIKKDFDNYIQLGNIGGLSITANPLDDGTERKCPLLSLPARLKDAGVINEKSELNAKNLSAYDIRITAQQYAVGASVIADAFDQETTKKVLDELFNSSSPENQKKTYSPKEGTEGDMTFKQLTGLEYHEFSIINQANEIGKIQNNLIDNTDKQIKVYINNSINKIWIPKKEKLEQDKEMKEETKQQGISKFDNQIKEGKVALKNKQLDYSSFKHIGVNQIPSQYVSPLTETNSAAVGAVRKTFADYCDHNYLPTFVETIALGRIQDQHIDWNNQVSEILNKNGINAVDFIERRKEISDLCETFGKTPTKENFENLINKISSFMEDFPPEKLSPADKEAFFVDENGKQKTPPQYPLITEKPNQDAVG